MPRGPAVRQDHAAKSSDVQQRPALVVEIEVEQVPIGDEPEKANAACGEQDVPDAVPKPLLLIAPGNEGVENGDERAEAGEYAEDLQQMNPDVATLPETPGFLQTLQGDEQTDDESDIEEADDADDRAKALGAGIERKGLAIVPAENGGDGPEKNR